MDFLNALNGLGNLSSRGLFINSCFVHCQSEIQETWFAAGSPMLNKTVSDILTIYHSWIFNYISRCGYILSVYLFLWVMYLYSELRRQLQIGSTIEDPS